jgi:alpha-tubulin suppressor-like RCC1 family protein
MKTLLVVILIVSVIVTVVVLVIVLWKKPKKTTSSEVCLSSESSSEASTSESSETPPPEGPVMYQLYAWGYNSKGQLGIGTEGNYKDEPFAVDSTGVLEDKYLVQVASGTTHSMALDLSGHVYAWGENFYGQVGDETLVDRYIPVVASVISHKKIVQIATGGFHSMALDEDGVVWAWGRNNQGQLGVGNTNVQETAIQVIEITNIVAIDCGHEFSLALDASGHVYGWGRNNTGQVGIGSTVTPQSTPVQCLGALIDKTITRITCGYRHSFAIDNSGNLYGWGSNIDSQIGTGSVDMNITSPVHVEMPRPVVQAAAATNHSLAVTDLGELYMWGLSNALGFQDESNYEPQPRLLHSPSSTAERVKQAICGEVVTLMRLNNNKVYGWGSNTSGEIGDGSNIARQTPVLTKTENFNHRAVHQFSVRNRHVLALVHP